MSSTADYAPMFATPYTGPATKIINSIAGARFQSLKKRIAAGLNARSPITAGEFSSFPSGHTHIWRPEAGLAQRMALDGQADLAAAQLIVAACLAGGHGQISIPLREEGWIFVSGWTVRVRTQCVVTSCEGQLRISTGSGEMHFEIAQGRATLAGTSQSAWQAYNEVDGVPFYLIDAGIVISKESFPWIADYPDAIARSRDNPSIADDKNKILEGWKVLTDYAPIYKEWVASTMHGGLLVENQDALINTSGSSCYFPGLVYLQAASPTKIGECLVHECAHQHFYAYSLLAPMVEENSSEQFFSPIKHCERKLYNILLAAHAVANIIKYYDEISDHISLDEADQGKHKMLREWFDSDYCAALNVASSLTESGQRFWATTKEIVR